MFNKISIKAILYGFAVGCAADLFGGMLSAAIWNAVTSTPNYLMDTVIGVVTGILAGYVTGRVAKSSPVLNATVLGLFAIAFSFAWEIFGFLPGFLSNIKDPLWYEVIGYLTIIPCTYGGGRLASAVSNKKAKIVKKCVISAFFLSLVVTAIFLVQPFLTPSPQKIEHLRTLAKSGDSEAQRKLGDLYYVGKGVPKDMTEAGMLYERAAVQGNASAQFSLAELCDKGFAFQADPESAYKWASLSLKDGFSPAVLLTQKLQKKLSQAQIDEANKWVENWKPMPPSH